MRWALRRQFEVPALWNASPEDREQLEIIKVCPKHLIGYSTLYCPECVKERQAKKELEKARRQQEQVEREERHRRIEQVRARASTMEEKRSRN